jgi:HK97 family phage portal protein
MRADAGGAPAPWDDYWYSPTSSPSSSGMRVNPETSKRHSTVIACVSVRAKIIGMLPGKIRVDLAGGGSKVVTNHPLYDVLAYQPNDVQTAYEFKMMMNAHVDLRGNAYALKVPGPRGPVDQLWPMHPDRVTVEVLKNTGRLIYVYNDPLTNETKRYTQDEVFHLRDWSDNMAVGQSRISMGVDVVGLALARQDYLARFMKNDARTGLVMTGLKFTTKEDEKKYIESVQAGNTAENRGKTMMLPPGVDAKSLSVTPVDAQLLEGSKYSDVQICSLFGVLPHMVGVDAGKAATFASTEQFNIMTAQYTVHPMVVMWEQCVQRDLIVSSRYYWKMSMAALLRGDNATRFAGYASAIAAGWMCPDDVRELEDLNPIPDAAGKVFWRSANLLPLKQLTAPIAPAKGPSRGESDNSDTSDPANDDGTDDGAGGDAGSKAQASAEMSARMQLLASGTADRCVRKEVSAVRKMIAQDAGTYQITEFYAEHWMWITEAFHMEATASLNVKIGCDARANHLSMLMADEDDEFHAAAQVWIEQIAATEAAKLTALAVEGVV